MGGCTPSLKSGIDCILLQLKEEFKGFTMPRFICPHCHSPVDPASMDFATGPEPVSSTRIRAALSEGRPRDARAMLGHWHRIEGPVVHGEKRGRELGFPTANMALDGLHLPRFGVYAVLVDVLDGPHAGSHRGVASLGVRPMFGENRPNLETYLFDFRGDLYGAELSVGLVDSLRPELRCDGVPALIAQMDPDAAQARACLAVV